MIARTTPGAGPRRRGFTLLELTLTVGMVAVAMMLTVRVLGWVAAERRATERRQYALQEASNLLDRLASRPFDRVTPESARAVALPEAARAALPGAELAVTVDGGDDTRRVAVRLRWRGRGGEWEAPVRLTTWVERRRERDGRGS